MLGIQIMDVEKCHQILVHLTGSSFSVNITVMPNTLSVQRKQPVEEDQSWVGLIRSEKTPNRLQTLLGTKLVTPNIGFQANCIFALHTAFPYTIAHFNKSLYLLLIHSSRLFAQHCTCKTLKASWSFMHELFSLLAINLQLCAKYLKLIINYLSQYLQCSARQDRFSKMNYGQLNYFLSSAASTCISRPWAERAAMFAFPDSHCTE